MAEPAPYLPRRASTSHWLDLRGLRYHLRTWGSSQLTRPERPPLVLLHGWMDVSASFQFVVDAFTEDRFIVAPDWRGFGLTDGPSTDSYWFPDYLGDLEFILDHVACNIPVDLVGHSMGGNV